MIYSISVKLARGSESLREFLKSNGFEIRCFDTLKGSYYDHEPDDKNTNLIIQYHCYYKSSTKPKLEILEKLWEEPFNKINFE